MDTPLCWPPSNRPASRSSSGPPMPPVGPAPFGAAPPGRLRSPLRCAPACAGRRHPPPGPSAAPDPLSRRPRRSSMSRVQLALNVDDVDEAVAFYSRLFGAEPAKRRPGYANFALDEPALKLVLIENPGAGGSLQPPRCRGCVRRRGGRRDPAAGRHRARDRGRGRHHLLLRLQDKVWVTGPGGERWEVYTVLADAPVASRGQRPAPLPPPPAADLAWLTRGEVTTMSDCCDETTECCEPGCC